ncbi:MAG: DUF2812 domain-containing protein [Bacillota bacterium]|nr:DUF2812 domain-containing protein [Bacillota bacterium]
MSENLENTTTSNEKMVFGKRSEKRSRATFVEEKQEPVEEIQEDLVEHVEMIFEKEQAPFVILDDDTKEPLQNMLKEEEKESKDSQEIALPKEDLEPIIQSKEPEEGFLKENAEEIIIQAEQADLLRVDAQEEVVEYIHEEELTFNEEDLFYEKKSFLLTQYEKVEQYLEKKSNEGYHFVRKVGKKFYFVQGEKTPYYYNLAYFKNEPSDELWDQWEKLGWKLISRTPSKKKKEAGWFYFRHLDVSNEYRRTIENEEEKYNFFRKYANTCRSNVFFLFICMMVCLVSAFLQWQFKGLWIGIIACAVIFTLAFFLFLSYMRMMLINRKTAKKLRIQLRLQARRRNFHGEDYDPETDAQLETDWNEIEMEKENKKKRKG